LPQRIAPEDYPDTGPVEVFTLDRRRLRWTLGESWAFLEETDYPAPANTTVDRKSASILGRCSTNLRVMRQGSARTPCV